MGARQAASEESTFRLDDVALARLRGWTRVAIGATLLLAPKWSARLWAGRGSDWIGDISIRQVGGREVLIGAGLLRAIERGEPLREWLALSAAADATDVLAVLGEWKHMPGLRRWGFLIGAAAATAVGTKLALDLE